jgi:hypothetical protein
MTQTRLVARTTITAPAKISVALNVNGRQRQLKLALWTTLLDALLHSGRDRRTRLPVA